MEKEIKAKIDIIIENFIKFKDLTPQIYNISMECVQSIKNGGKVIFVGNGGSASDSNHLTSELVGRYKLKRHPLPAISLSVDTSILTSLGNDFGFDSIFERQIEALGKKEDIVIAITTSGKSQNVINAVIKAKEMGIKTVALTGDFISPIESQADITVKVPSKITNNIQEMQIALGHIMADIIENTLTNK